MGYHQTTRKTQVKAEVITQLNISYYLMTGHISHYRSYHTSSYHSTKRQTTRHTHSMQIGDRTVWEQAVGTPTLCTVQKVPERDVRETPDGVGCTRPGHGEARVSASQWDATRQEGGERHGQGRIGRRCGPHSLGFVSSPVPQHLQLGKLVRFSGGGK